MGTVAIPVPLWAPEHGWFDATTHTLETGTDDELVESYNALTQAEADAKALGRHVVAITAARRWAEFVIGARLGPGTRPGHKPIDPPPAFKPLGSAARYHCRRMARLDCDVLYDHLRRARSLDEVSRAACLAYVDASAAA